MNSPSQMMLVQEESILHDWYDTFFRDVVEHPDVEEIAINRAREAKNPHDTVQTILWVKHRKEGGWLPYKSPLTFEDIGLFLYQFANYKGIHYDQDARPYLFDTLPGGARLSAVHGAAIRYEKDARHGTALCIRQGDRVKDKGVPFPLQPTELSGFLDPDSETLPYEEVMEAVRGMVEKREGIAWIGTMGCGKTTQIKRATNLLPKKWRYIYLEDTRELPPTQPNSVFNYVPRTAENPKRQWGDVELFATRSTTDGLIFGEMSPDIAFRLPSFINIGCAPVQFSIHAEDEEDALTRLYHMIRQGGAEISWDYYKRLLLKVLHWLVVLKRDPTTNRRWVQSVTRIEEVFARIKPPEE